MTKRVIGIIVMVCMLLLSCSTGNDAKLCHVSFSQDDQSKALVSMTIGQSCPVTFGYYVRIPEDKAPVNAYASVAFDTWLPVEELQDVILSQGKWTFDAIAIDTMSTEENIAEKALLKGCAVEYVNLNTSTISIPLNEYAEGNGTVNLVYELSDENGNANSLNITSSELQPLDGSAVGTLSLGNNTLPAGKYLFKVIVKNSSTGAIVFRDLVAFPVYPNTTTTISGKYQLKKPSTEITTQTGTDPETGVITGLKEALDWAGTVHEDTVEVHLGNEIAINTKPETGDIVFPIPDCVTDVSIDMDGQAIRVPNSMANENLTMFHVDTGVSLNFQNSNAAQANLFTGNKGAVVSLDGGSIKLQSTAFQPSNGKVTIGMVNLCGHDPVTTSLGGTINLTERSYIQDADYGVSNIVPGAKSKTYTTVNGNVNINLDGQSTLAGGSYAIELRNVTGDINIVVDNASQITGGIYLVNITGNVNITVKNGSSIRDGIYLSSIHGNVSIKADASTIVGGQFGFKVSSMDANKTITVELNNNATITGTSQPYSIDASGAKNVSKVFRTDDNISQNMKNAFSKSNGWN